MKYLKDIVSELSQNYQDKRENISGIDLIEEDLYMMSGVDHSDPHALLLIKIDSPHLEYIGSSCGKVGNKIFSDKGLIDFLKNKDVEHIIGILYDPDSEYAYQGEAIGLNSIAMPIVGEDGYVFEDLAGELKGSFRYEESRIKGWSVYESE
ncbi:MAG: hypothetical protein KKA79_02545 [Nanoarchaeota archaeon]|nr:hypothetical protein [Nanoarchaeota archaeon]MCG2718920.1 hypothetical protein [Nanoarchaeota archaeon]